MRLLEQGGWVLAAVFVLSFVTWFLIIFEWLRLREEIGNGLSTADAALGRLQRGMAAEAATICRARPNMSGNLMLAVLDAQKTGRILPPRRLKSLVKTETDRLRRHLKLIAVSGMVLPLLGLLGTVLGMMETFDALTLSGSREADELMAAGISRALITTQAGLVAALPIVLMHGILSSRIRRYTARAVLVLKSTESLLSRKGNHV